MRKGLDLVFLILAGGLLLLPGLGMLLKWELEESCENRVLAILPIPAPNKEYIDSLELYFKDHFFGRKQLLEQNTELKWQVFGSSANTKKAVIGRDDWLFYASKTDYEFNSVTNQNQLDGAELRSKVSDIEKRFLQLKDKGIAYYFACWPNRSSMVKSKLPERYASQIEAGKSRADQLEAALHAKNIGLSLLRCDSLMAQHTDNNPLYLKHDTHWNDLGAFYAYQALLRHMGMEPLSIDQYTLKWEEQQKGDLLGILGICASEEHSEFVPKLYPNPPLDDAQMEESGNAAQLTVTNPNAMSDQKILVFRDSYTSAMIPYISMHFSEAVFVWTNYRQSVVDEENPQVVLSAKVERYL